MKTVLIADDTDNVRLLYEMFVSEWGYNPMMVTDGVEAFDAFKKYHPDAIITDNQMPNMGGMELVERVRTMCSETPILFHSGRELPTVVGIPNLYTGAKGADLQYMKDFLDYTIGEKGAQLLSEALENDKTGVWQPDDMHRNR